MNLKSIIDTCNDVINKKLNIAKNNIESQIKVMPNFDKYYLNFFSADLYVSTILYDNIKYKIHD